MAYFRAMSSAGGVTATITVTYDSTYYNKTMTCTNGTKTYTKTTTSSGSTTFNVSEEGTWTITCNGVSRTVNVVLSYTTQMSITKTVTVYSAASDTVSFTDATGAKTVTTNSNGVGSVNITFTPPSANITFKSSIAKNPNKLSQAYSKSITINTNTTVIYIMPNGVLYWYGYIGTVNDITVEPCTTANGWSYGYGATFNTNEIDISSTSDTSKIYGVGTKQAVPLANYSTLTIINTGVSAAGGTYAQIGANSTKVTNSDNAGTYTVSGLNKKIIDFSTWSSTYYLGIANAANTRHLKVHAIMLE